MCCIYFGISISKETGWKGSIEYNCRTPHKKEPVHYKHKSVFKSKYLQTKKRNITKRTGGRNGNGRSLKGSKKGGKRRGKEEVEKRERERRGRDKK